MIPSDFQLLLSLLQRKNLALKQSMENLEPGDTINLSLTAYQEAQLKLLLQQTLTESQSPWLTLSEKVNETFFTAIEERKAALLQVSEEEAYAAVYEYICSSVGQCLDDKQEGFTQLLLSICIEIPDLFTKQPDNTTCIADNDAPGEVNAQHCVYHNLYDLLKDVVEITFSDWHQEHKKRG